MLPLVVPRRARSDPVACLHHQPDEVPSPRRPTNLHQKPLFITPEEETFRRQNPDYGRFRHHAGRGTVTIDAVFDREFAHLRGRHYLDAAGAAPTPASIGSTRFAARARSRQ